MVKMKLTDSEIKRIWRNRAHDTNKMLKCLSELNACSVDAVREKCVSLGLISESEQKEKNDRPSWMGGWEEEELDNLVSFRQAGMKFTEIASRMGRSESGVRHTYKMIEKMRSETVQA